jgi:hypothetical protein
MTAWTAADKESVEIAERALADMKQAGAQIVEVSADLDKALALLLPYLDPAYLASPGPYVDPDQLRRLAPNHADSARYPGNYYAKHADAPFAMDFLVNSFVSPETTLLDRKRFPDFDINKTLNDARTNPFEFRYAFNRYLQGAAMPTLKLWTM